MKLGYLLGPCALAAATVLAVACSSSEGGTGGGGATGTGGSASSSSGNVGGSCHGDATVWNQVTAGPITCTTNSDCCVVINGCTSTAQIVTATNQAKAKAAMDTCGNCNNCIPPAIQVGCDNGVCVGTVVDFADGGMGLTQDHCGVDAPIGFTPGKLSFSCGG
jgi:hypothetical protein